LKAEPRRDHSRNLTEALVRPKPETAQGNIGAVGMEEVVENRTGATEEEGKGEWWKNKYGEDTRIESRNVGGAQGSGVGNGLSQEEMVGTGGGAW